MTAIQAARGSSREAALAGPRVALRLFEARDLTPRYVGWLNDPEVTRYLEVGKRPVTREAAAAYVRRFLDGSAGRLFAIIDQASGRHIGNVTLNHVDVRQGTADTGLMIGDTSFWGRGYATEAWRLLFGHAFETLGLRVMTAGAVVGHEASIRALRALGFTLEGTVHRDGPGFSWETYRFSLRREEFRAAASAGRA